MLISSFIEYYDIDVENELNEEVKAHSEITVATLNKIGLRRLMEINGFARPVLKKMRRMVLEQV